MKKFAPDKIYLHDPHGYFDDDSGKDNTVMWSEDKINEDDIEYIQTHNTKTGMDRENLEWLVWWCLQQESPPISISRGKELLRFADMEQMRKWSHTYHS